VKVLKKLTLSIKST